MKIKIKINKGLLMSPSDFEFIEKLNEDKPNLPSTKLSKAESVRVGQIYRAYISNHIDHIDWGLSLDDTERKEKWPSGSRMKSHEAKRIVLSSLMNLNRRFNKRVGGKGPSQKEVLMTLSSVQYCRYSYRKVTHYFFDIQQG